MSWFHHHDAVLAHAGHGRTFNYLRKRCFWHDMSQMNLSITNACGQCVLAKKRRLNLPRKQIYLPIRKMANVPIDVYGLNALPKVENRTCTLTMMYILTSLIVSASITSATWGSIQKTIVRNWISHFGLPDAVHSDDKFFGEAGHDWL